MNRDVYQALSLVVKENASQLVDLCIAHGHEETAELLRNLDIVASARLLERLPAWFSGMVLGHLDDKLLVALINCLEVSASARLLRTLSTDRRQSVLDKLEPRHAKKLASFAAVDESRVGSVVRTSALSVEEGTAVSAVLDLVRQHPDRVLDYVYVVDANSKLTGLLPVKRLLLGAAGQRVDSLVTLNPDSLRIDEPLLRAATHPRWGRAKVMPVVDRQDSFAGVVGRMDLPGNRVSETASQDASIALAETFWVGLRGLLHLLSMRTGGRS